MIHVVRHHDMPVADPRDVHRLLILAMSSGMINGESLRRNE
jgi:hypothetical protein